VCRGVGAGLGIGIRPTARGLPGTGTGRLKKRKRRRPSRMRNLKTPRRRANPRRVKGQVQAGNRWLPACRV
jgi:hypothetical protein